MEQQHDTKKNPSQSPLPECSQHYNVGAQLLIRPSDLDALEKKLKDSGLKFTSFQVGDINGRNLKWVDFEVMPLEGEDIEVSIERVRAVLTQITNDNLNDFQILRLGRNLKNSSQECYVQVW